MPSQMRERPILKGEDAKRFLERERQVDEKRKEFALEYAKKQCKTFGNPCAMIKYCIDCFHDNENLWIKCMNYKDKIIRGKKYDTKN